MQSSNGDLWLVFPWSPLDFLSCFPVRCASYSEATDPSRRRSDNLFWLFCWNSQRKWPKSCLVLAGQCVRWRQCTAPRRWDAAATPRATCSHHDVNGRMLTAIGRQRFATRPLHQGRTTAAAAAGRRSAGQRAADATELSWAAGGEERRRDDPRPCGPFWGRSRADAMV